MGTHQITAKEVELIQELEDIILKLDSLSSLTTVCGSAFINDDSFGNMAPREVHQAFNSISSQIGEISADVGCIIAAIYEQERGC